MILNHASIAQCLETGDCLCKAGLWTEAQFRSQTLNWYRRGTKTYKVPPFPTKEVMNYPDSSLDW